MIDNKRSLFSSLSSIYTIDCRIGTIKGIPGGGGRLGGDGNWGIDKGGAGGMVKDGGGGRVRDGGGGRVKEGGGRFKIGGGGNEGFIPPEKLLIPRFRV